MRVVIVHDYIKEYGGAERVLETLHEMYSDAPVFTLIYAPDFLGPHKDRFKGWDIRPSFLQQIPFGYKLISIFRLIAPFVFKTFDFSGYDAVIVSATGAYSPNIINKKDAKQICYCHTPPRYLYGYETAREQGKNPVMKFLVMLMIHALRMVDFESAKNVDRFVANSENVKARIQKFYRRNAMVVYPPVEIQKYHVSSIKYQAKENTKYLISNTYYLCGGRLARPKHLDLIVKSFAKLNLPLKVFGKSFAGYGEELKRLAKPNIEFMGEVSDSEKIELMSGAKAFVFASVDEDFGIVPVEAMMCGTPVVAFKSGGVMESVVDGKTGVFFDQLTVESLSGAIKKLENLKIRPEDCKKQAEKFSKANFVKGMRSVIASVSKK